ncbi:hypothetical protein PM082_000018 [Marasmius tenuissimus]|nr:hypothetical protein PM082_000018 [Marasmius tenuissimus]
MEALFSGSAGIEGVSRAYNRRFIFTPSAVAYPKFAEEVSKGVTMGGGMGCKSLLRMYGYIANGLGGKNDTLNVDMSKMKGLSVGSASYAAIIETENRLGMSRLGWMRRGER